MGRLGHGDLRRWRRDARRTEPQQAPSLPKFPEKTSLPELPKSESEKASLDLPTLPKEMQKSRFAPLPKSSREEDSIPSVSKSPSLPERKLKEKPIYIRLDKFEHTEESFNEIKNKIREIESLLSKIRDTKAKEEKELESWEREIQVVKARIESIDKNIFNKF